MRELKAILLVLAVMMAVAIAVAMTEDHLSKDAHGVPCTISLECQ